MTTASAEANDAPRSAVWSRARALAEWWQGTAVLGVLLLVTAAAFALLAYMAHSTPYFPIDLTLTLAIQQVRMPALDALAYAACWPGFPPQSNVFFGSIIALLAVCRKFLAAVAQAVAAGGSAALWFAIAPQVGRPRPSSDLVYVSEQIQAGSFPSGHVLNLTAALGFTWLLAYTLLPRTWYRTLVLWVIPAFLVLLGLARVYLGQHWPSDVLGGYLLGAIWLWVTVTGYRWAERWTIRRDRGSLAASLN